MQISQYLCSTCGSVLKETSEYIEIHSLREECPSCGTLLAESLQRMPLRPAIRWTPPKIQTADSLLKLRFDIAKIDSFLGLGKSDLCCITGFHANLVLTRLCVRSLLPRRYGGLNSPYVMMADVGNRTDVYGAINFARQYGLDKENVADRILVVRGFTVPQVRQLITAELPKIVKKYQIRSVMVPGLLNSFDEEQNMKLKEVRKELGRIMKALNELSKKVVVVTSIHEGRYAHLVLPEFEKRIDLKSEMGGRLTAELYNRGQRKTVSLTQRELKIVSDAGFGDL